ncbi:hypothetical protein LCGC14_2983960 [marine sediment metagenome]|uniref:Uncharacterized protein n=1 Tax=marine sediment metagenome TaxID=412755 RepID=A0A0F8ZD99_9ZZZZ
MNQNELDSEPNKQNYSFIPPEFNTHVIRLSPTTINILKNNFKYKFEKFYEKLEDIYLNWSGTLDAEFLYLLSKVGVLTIITGLFGLLINIIVANPTLWFYSYIIVPVVVIIGFMILVISYLKKE